MGETDDNWYLEINKKINTTATSTSTNNNNNNNNDNDDDDDDDDNNNDTTHNVMKIHQGLKITRIFIFIFSFFLVSVPCFLVSSRGK